MRRCIRESTLFRTFPGSRRHVLNLNAGMAYLVESVFFATSRIKGIEPYSQPRPRQVEIEPTFAKVLLGSYLRFCRRPFLLLLHIAFRLLNSRKFSKSMKGWRTLYHPFRSGWILFNSPRTWSTSFVVSTA